MELTRADRQLCQNLLVMIMTRKIVIFGAGGHAKVVIDAVEKHQEISEILLFDDDEKLWGKQFYGHSVLGNLEKLLKDASTLHIDYAVVAIGNINQRLKVAKALENHGIRLSKVIHPSSVISKGVLIGSGTVLFANTVINADTQLGRHVIINTGATVDHDCNIADGVHIAPGASICGGVVIGYGSFIGAGAVIIPGVKIGSHVIVGAGSTVINNIADNLKVVGSPAREI